MFERLATDRRVDQFTRGFILVFSLAFLLFAAVTPTHPVGESANYMLATISLENRASLFFTDADVRQAEHDFPEHIEFIKYCYAPESRRMWIAPDGRRHCYYFSVYSALCIPVKKILALFGGPQSYAFAFTNVLLYAAALWTVHRKLQADRKIVCLTVLLLACSPTVLYYWWPSAEICLFSLLVMSLVFLANRNHRMAGLLVSIAGMMNVTVMAYGSMIIVDYFIRLLRGDTRVPAGGLRAHWRSHVRQTLLLALCFVPCLIPFIYNRLEFGGVVSSLAWSFKSAGYGGRFVAYLTDLNFGILPYFPLGLALLLAGMGVALWRRRFHALILPAGFLLTTAAFCINFHINCGITGIHRYNAWVFAIMVFFLTVELPGLVRGPRLRNGLLGALLISAGVSAGVVCLTRFSPTGMTYTEMGPIAAFVLDKAPRLYRPYPYSFISRVTHVDGGYDYDGPVIYYNHDGYARKILVTPETAAQVLDEVSCDAADWRVLQEKVKRAQAGTGFEYIDLNGSTKVMERGID